MAQLCHALNVKSEECSKDKLALQKVKVQLCNTLRYAKISNFSLFFFSHQNTERSRFLFLQKLKASV